MSPRSPRGPRSATRIYGGIVLAVTTITVGVFVFRKLWGTGNKTQGEGNSKPGHDPNTAQPPIDQVARDELDVSTPVQSTTQPVDHSAGDESQLVPSYAPPAPTGTSEPQSINQDARDEPNPDISILAQPSITPRPQPVEHSARDESQLGISGPTHAPPTTSEPQFINQDVIDEHDLNTLIPADPSGGDEGRLGISIPSQVPQFIDQDVKDKDTSILAQASTTSRSYGDIGSEELPSIASSQGSSNFQISETNATIIRNGDGRFTKIQRDLSCGYIANLDIAWPAINDNLKTHALTESIIDLRAEAVLNDYQNNKSGFCFKGTRAALLREMADCVTGSSQCRMYILSGLADTGKSTVAYTIASRAADLNLLGASFVFSRDDSNRNNAKRFFTTIAYQLCVYNETFSQAIGDALEITRRSMEELLETEDESMTITEDPQDQLQSLILDPLRSIVQSRSRPVLIVVDALDECDEEDAISVLTGLSQLVRDRLCFISFKVILTTRPEPYLDHFFSSQSDHTFFHLQDIIEDKVVGGDIRFYLDHDLSTKQVQKCYPMQQWSASDEELGSLACIAGNFFFIALMAVRYILDKTASNPAAQMQKLLCATAQDDAPFKDLDSFYTVMLQDVVPEDCDDDDIVSRYQSVVGTIISVQHPLPVSAFAHLIGIDVEEIRAVLDRLQSVILLGDDNVPHFYHKSFYEYVTDQSRCKYLHLRIDPGARTRHTQIATRCFEIMNKHLKRNILGLGGPARFMSNEDSLKEDGITNGKLEEKIPQQLRYACVYWVYHLRAGNIEDAALIRGLETFVEEHMLHWFEVLSLIGKLDSAHLAIDVVLKLLELSSDLHQLLSDGVCFIERFYAIIKRSALHTYSSSLLFTPTDSLLYRRYIQEAMHNIYAIEGGPEKCWDALIAKLRHGDNVDVVKFSLDSSLFMSCTEKLYHIKGKLKIWGAAMGTPISMVPGDRFAVANDFSTIALSQENITMDYNANGSSCSTMFTTPLKIQKLALSSESSRVAAALSDGTVWLWESRKSAELIDNFDGFKHGKWSKLEFSPTGKRLAYSSANGIIKLRDGISGGFIADLRCGLQSLKFEFSADDSRIAAMSYDGGCLTLWNSDSGGLIGDAGEVDCESLAISASGSLIATSHGNKVTLWNDSLVQIKVLQVEKPGLMTFSLNNMLAIATGPSVKLYYVKTHSFIHSLPIYGSPSVVAFSSDCTRLAVGHRHTIGHRHHGNVNLYDIRGIDASGPPSIKATVVTVLALSRDCSRLACGFEDGAVELWETTPTKRRIDSHQAHTTSVTALEFGPDGGLFASSGDYEPIKLWNGRDGSLRGTLYQSGRSNSVALSNSVLVATGDCQVTLWSLDTLSLIHTFDTSSRSRTISIAENSALIAVAHDCGVSLLDAMNHRTITRFLIDDEIHTMTFLPDNSHLVALSKDGVFLSFNLVNKHITKRATLEHLIQLPNISLWRGVPIWHCQGRDSEQHYFAALFSQHKSPIPVLWIPECIDMTTWTQGPSMIALGCRDGRVILLRLPTSHVG